MLSLPGMPLKAAQDCRKIVDRRKKWAEVRMDAPPLYPQWTEEDEAKLVDKKKFNIDVSDTALGREKARMERDLKIAATNMSRDKRNSMIKLLEDQHEKDDRAQAAAVTHETAAEHFQTSEDEGALERYSITLVHGCSSTLCNQTSQQSRSPSHHPLFLICNTFSPVGNLSGIGT